MAVGDFRCTFADVAFRNPDPSVLDRLERFGLLTDPRDFMPERIFPGPALQKLGRSGPDALSAGEDQSVVLSGRCIANERLPWHHVGG